MQIQLQKNSIIEFELVFELELFFSAVHAIRREEASWPQFQCAHNGGLLLFIDLKEGRGIGFRFDECAFAAEGREGIVCEDPCLRNGKLLARSGDHCHWIGEFWAISTLENWPYHKCLDWGKELFHQPSFYLDFSFFPVEQIALICRKAIIIHHSLAHQG